MIKGDHSGPFAVQLAWTYRSATLFTLMFVAAIARRAIPDSSMWRAMPAASARLGCPTLTKAFLPPQDRMRLRRVLYRTRPGCCLRAASRRFGARGMAGESGSRAEAGALSNTDVDSAPIVAGRSCR